MTVSELTQTEVMAALSLRQRIDELSLADVQQGSKTHSCGIADGGSGWADQCCGAQSIALAYE